MENANDTLSFLSDSTARSRVLRAFDEERKLTRDDLYDRLDASRRTVKRACSALEERGYVACEDGSQSYRLTALGDSIADAHRTYVERTATAERLCPFLSQVDADAFDLDVAALADAELVVSDDAAPLAAFDRFAELRAAADTVRMVSPLVQAESIRQVAEHAGTETFSFEVVLGADAVEAARSEYGELFEETLGADEFATYRYEGEVPFVVAVLDERAVLGVSKNGTPHTIVISENETVREWVEETYERHREAATRLG